ncbi:MAG: hypothetical protein Q9172_000304 [Xanthocarpia lactea]
MFVKLPALVLLAVTAVPCLAAPTADADGLSVREPKRRPGLASYPKCGAPICKRDGEDAEADLGTSLTYAFFELEADQGSVTRAANLAGSEVSSKREVQIDCQKRLRCPPGGKSTKVKGRCLCLPTKLVRDVSGSNSIDAEADLVTRAADVAGSELSSKRDVQIDCQKRLRCPPGGKSTKVKGRCLCLPTKLVRDVSESNSVEEAVPQALRRNAEDDYDAATLDCASIAKCSKGAHPIKYKGNCVCVPWFPNLQEERDLSSADANL